MRLPAQQARGSGAICGAPSLSAASTTERDGECPSAVSAYVRKSADLEILSRKVRDLTTIGRK